MPRTHAMHSTLIPAWLELPGGRHIELRGSAGIGRAPENAVVLEDGLVSRRHALIQAQDAEFWLVDLGSANGSQVNGKRIAQPVKLSPGDVIQISSVRMKFTGGRPSAPARSTKPALASTRMNVKNVKCWFMIADIEGSTRLAQQVSAEELPRITGNWFKNCREITDAFGGQIMKYLGDGFFCYWESREDSPAQIRKALKKLRTMQERTSPPFRVVLHYGEAVFASVPTLAEVNLHGSEVNFVFRMEKIAGGLNQRIMFSEAANARLNVSTQMIGEMPVSGYPGKFRFFAPAAA